MVVEFPILLKINLGSGPRAVTGWVNLDGALGARLHKTWGFKSLNRLLGLTNASWDHSIQIHDLRRPLPWTNNAVDVVYTSHTLEHMSRDDGETILRECFRVLKPSGVLRILVPDLAAHVQNYVEGQTRAEDFVEELGVLYGTGKQGWKRLTSRFIEFPHQCMYDTPSLLRVCRAIGFECEAKQAFDSLIEDIRNIELEDRTVGAVVVECRKPAPPVP